MFCHKCGYKLSDGADFCSKCGTQIPQGNSVQVPLVLSEVVIDEAVQVESPKKGKRGIVVGLLSLAVIIVFVLAITLSSRAPALPSKNLTAERLIEIFNEGTKNSNYPNIFIEKPVIEEYSSKLTSLIYEIQYNATYLIVFVYPDTNIVEGVRMINDGLVSQCTEAFGFYSGLCFKQFTESADEIDRMSDALGLYELNYAVDGQNSFVGKVATFDFSIEDFVNTLDIHLKPT